jgi:photosystem II stability/assembly factor-like uncharacterized protein
MPRYFLLLPAIFAFLACTPPARAALHPGDAAVRAIQFADEREGWAVGDDGVIWHSIDGGQTWERQASGTPASLRSIHFLTPYTGWIVGRIELPGGSSRGVVLATSDGGLKWAPVATQALPGLNAVRFFNQRSGIAAGDGSDAYPTGLFTTNDGGITWRPVPGKRCPTWLAADFSDTESGALAGPWGQLATVRDGLFGAADVDPIGGRSISGLKLNGPFAVAVGQGGLILTSSKSAGLKWGFAIPNLPKDVLAACDFEAVAVNGNHLWVAGRPGTFVLHSPDLGQNWELQKTGQALPLHSLSFVNENLGWATGDMGTILTTGDGGKNWKVVRQQGQRAAVLFVHASGAALPLETVALLSEDEGYHTAAISLTCAGPPAAPARRPEDDRLAARKLEPSGAHPQLALEPEKFNAAMRLVGGAAGESLWQFPVPHQLDGCKIEQIVGHWDKLHGDRSTAQVLRQLVLAIRIWRPEVIVTDRLRGSPTEALVVEAVKQAFAQAADPRAFPEQLSLLRLQPWTAKKLYAIADQPGPDAVKVPIDEVRVRLGDCPRDFAQLAGLLMAATRRPAAERGYQLLLTHLSGAVGDSHLLQGIELAQGGQARRELPPFEDEAIQARPALIKAVQQRRTLEGFAQGANPDLARPEQVLAQLGPALKEMPGDLGARAAFTIAQQFADAGQWAYAREAFLMMADRYPRHPLVLDAYRWLVRFQSSSEARRRQELGQFAIVTDVSVRPADKSQQTGPLKGGVEIVQASHAVELHDNDQARQWFTGSLALEPRFSALGAMYADDPAMQLCWMSAHRQLGEPEQPKKWFSRYLSGTAVPLGGQTIVRGADPWRDCAMAELWLLNRSFGTSPGKPLAYCPRVETKPVLDGKLDDPCWQDARPLVLATTAGDLETTVAKDEHGQLNSAYAAKAWFTFDREYLYIAVACTHPAGQRVPPVAKRTRDMDLRGFDRVSIMLDLDRDYQTYFHLQIDQRGCLAEDCWGDKKWDPQWFVAVASDDTGWTAEAAIPLRELTATPPNPGNTWAVNVTRIVPGKGVQAWSTPADATPRPEGMGLLQFIQSGKR